MAAYRCEQCRVIRESGNRLPRGWKRRDESVYCDKCWRAAYALRAITIPVVGPICAGKLGAKDSAPMEWPELRERLKASWIATTQASNWILRQLAVIDPGLVGGKLAKMPRSYFYPELRKRWPALATCSVVSLDQAAQQKYRAARFDLALCQASLPTMRYPVPIPVHNATWSVWEDEGGRLLLSFMLGEGRVTVRLRGGPNYRRQLLGLRKIMRGEAVQGELAIYRVNANHADHRNGDTKGTRVMAKMVAWLPKDEARGQTVAALHTGGDAFLTLYDEARNTIFTWNADHVRRRVARHDQELQRLREDLKAERRLGRERDGVLARMELVSRNHAHYMHSFCHQVSAEVVGLLKRRRAGLAIYVDADQGYMPHFPWHKLGEMLADKAGKAGIEFTSSDAASDSPEPLEAETQQ